MPPDTLRPPSPLDPTASAYKDWFHLNFAEPDSGTVGLINASLHGSPWDGRARAVGTVLVHSPQWGWKSHVEIKAYADANLAGSVIALTDTALAIDGRSGTIHASLHGAGNPFSARLAAEPLTAPLDIEQPLPLGSGWISWYLVPSLRLSGEWATSEGHNVLRNAPAYHDHNWGRWHWGEDFGWEWGCFLGAPEDPHAATIIFGRTCDRAHRRFGTPFLIADSRRARRRFAPECVTVKYGGYLEAPLHRVPGAMAALHQEMAEPRLPGAVGIDAKQGDARVTIEFTARAAAQFVTADPEIRGYGFIHEIVGAYHAAGTMAGLAFETNGYGVFEYVM